MQMNNASHHSRALPRQADIPRQSHSLGRLLQQLRQAAADEITLGELVRIFERRGFGVLLLIFSFIVFLPTGMIPGISTLSCIMMVLVAGQMLFGQDSIWLPRRLAEKRMKDALAARESGIIERIALWLDRISAERFPYFFTAIPVAAAALISIVMASITIVLALVPGLGSLTSIPVMLFGMGLSLRDGLFMLGGFVATGLLAGAGVVWPLLAW